MTFVAPLPGQTYQVRVYAAFGFTVDDDPGSYLWTDITKYVRNSSGNTYGPITFSGGRSSVANTADPSQITLMLDNIDGRFTARSPLLRNGSPNPYWPNVVKNTPLKVAVTWLGAVAEYELLTTFVDGWPLQPNAGLINVTVPISASGRLKRIRRSNKQLFSPLRRQFTGFDSYWPLEEDSGAQQFSPVGGGFATVVNGQTLAASTAVPGSALLPDWSIGNTVVFNTGNMALGANGWEAHFCVQVGVSRGATTGLVHLARLHFGDGTSWQLYLDLTGNEWQVDFIAANGTVTSAALVAPFAGTNSFNGLPGINPFDGQPHMIDFVADFTLPSTRKVHLVVDNQEVDNIANPGSLIGNVALVRMGGTATAFPLIMGHLAVSNGPPFSLSTNNTRAMLGWTGELATDRVTRLCGELGWPVTVVTGPVPAQQLGAQPIDTAANILDAAADVDNGLFHDAGSSGSFVYTTGAARYNAAVATTLDYNRRQVGDGLAPTFDDQDLATEWTISRANGSSATYDAPNANDVYAQQDTVNAALDSQLLDIAGWRVHEGTYDAYRLPTISINMRTTPELAQAATSMQYPSRLSPINIPLPYPQESLDQFVEGFSTIIDSVQWETSYSCQPYGPWQVAVWDQSRYDAAGTVLTAAETSTSTDITVTPANPGDWTTSVASFPFTLSIDQERVTAVDCTNGTSIITADGTFETGGVTGWVPFGGTFTADGAHVHSGLVAGKLVAAGGGSAGARPTAPAATALQSYTLSMWAFATAITTNVTATIGWMDSSHAAISDSTTTVTLAANTWTRITVPATAPALTAFASFGPTLSGTPTTGTTIWVDDVALTNNTGAAGSTQTFTVVRGAGGVRSSHAINTPVHIYPLPIVAI